MYAAQHAADHPDQVALVLEPGGRSLTYGQLEAWANRVAHLLRACGMRRGDHLAVLSTNGLPMLAVEAAAERTGVYYTLVNSHLQEDEVAYLLDDSRSRLLFASADRLGVAAAAARRCTRLEACFVLDGRDAPAGWQLLDATVATLPETPVDEEQLGAPMFYSSGTTGKPKGILRPLATASPEAAMPGRWFLQQLFSFREGMTYLSPAPLYHSAPQAAVATAIRIGATVVVIEHFDAEQWLALVERHRVTHSQMVPTMFHRLLRLPEDVRRRYDLSSLECVVHAAAPCPVPVKQAMIAWLGPIVTEYYAASESNGFTYCTSEEWLAHPGTVGRSVLGSVAILDDGGKECPPGADGTIWFRGPVAFEYFNDPEKTQESRDPEGTMSTVGDVGHLDGDGFLYLTDRKSYMIITGGVNVYPQETENLLATHPAVADVAVFGVPDPDMGEAVKAVVEPAPGVDAGPELETELINYCRGHLAHFKCPHSVDFSDELPRSPTGKLYKRLLRDRYWAGHPTSIS